MVETNQYRIKYAHSRFTVCLKHVYFVNT